MPSTFRKSCDHARSGAERPSRGRRCRPCGQVNAARAARAWKLFLLVPRMLLTRAAQQGSQGRAELLSRAAAFPARRVDPAHPQCQAVPAAFLGPQAGVKRHYTRVQKSARASFHGPADSGGARTRHGGRVAGVHRSAAATSATTLANSGRTLGIRKGAACSRIGSYSVARGKARGSPRLVGHAGRAFEAAAPGC